MRTFLRACAVAVLVTVPTVATAQKLTPRDLVALSKAGLGDDVLIALIDTNRTVFELGPYEVLELRQQGLSETVLVRLIRTAAAAMSPPAEAPAVPRSLPVVRSPLDIFRRDADVDPSPRTRRTEVPPVVVTPPPVEVTQTVRQEVVVEAPREVRVPVYVPLVVPAVVRPPLKEPEPEYWGFGGKRRPDSWEPSRKQELPVKPGGGGQ